MVSKAATQEISRTSQRCGKPSLKITLVCRCGRDCSKKIAAAKMQEWLLGYKAKCQMEDERNMMFNLLRWSILKAI